MFKTAHEGKLKLERELQRVKEELAMYKIQLDVAQKEIFRAQEIVDKVERQRLAAEEDAMRAKEKMRKLVQTRAVEQAMEEGRRLGFEEGLNQGRVYGTDSVETAETWDEPFLKQSTRRPNGKGEHGRSEVSRHTYPNEESASGSSHSSGTKSIRTLPHHQRAGDTKLQATQASTSNSRPRRESTAIHSAIHSTYPQPPTSQATTSNTRPRGNSTTAPPLQHPHGTPPDVARYPQSLPMPTITTPMPVPVPSTQPQIPPPMPPHQSGTTIHDHSFKNPEHIKIQPSDKPIHPIPIHNHSPSVSHPSIVLPPDGYIPTLDANSMISLPPPHELSIPVPAEAPPLPPPQERSSTRPRSGSRGRHNPSRHGEFSDADSVAYTTRTGRDPDVQKYSHPTSHTMSVRSRGSTQLSELDMLSPPHGYEGDRSERNRARSRPDVESPTPVRSRPRASTQSATEGIAERWRNENRDYIRSKSPPESSGSRKDTTGRDSQTNGRDSRNQIERPTSAGSTVYGRPASSNGMRDNMRPRRPREVVLPVPLGDPFVDPSTAHGHASFPPRNNTPSSAGYGRPTIQTTFPPNAQRSTSTATVPGIEVVTPSTHTQSMHSVRTVVDPILLTPESANRATPLPEQHVDQRPDSGLGLFTPGQGEERIEMTLPDNNLPPGFVPLSPIPGMENLNPYPPGFAPTLPKDHPGGGSTNYTYSSPLVRPT
ncbi:hypothetical protein BDZ97DRAFT_1818844 [Flammula alnicola]|nr:hypothetical protein BDZ97DRAFT_1818844 [Flammula alnicola]